VLSFCFNDAKMNRIEFPRKTLMSANKNHELILCKHDSLNKFIMPIRPDNELRLDYKVERFVGIKPFGSYEMYGTFKDCLNRYTYKNEAFAGISRLNRAYSKITNVKTGKTRFFV
jgi:hypothetical protein